MPKGHPEYKPEDIAQCPFMSKKIKNNQTIDTAKNVRMIQEIKESYDKS